MNKQNKWRGRLSIGAEIATILAVIVAIIAIFAGKTIIREVYYLSQENKKREAVTEIRSNLILGDLRGAAPKIEYLGKFPEYYGIGSRYKTIERSAEAKKLLTEGNIQSTTKITHYLIDGIPFEP